MDNATLRGCLRLLFNLLLISWFLPGFQAKADKGEDYFNRGSEAFQAGKLQQAVDHYNQARLYYDSLGQVKPCLRAGRLTFQVLLYTPLRDTTKGEVYQSLLAKAKTIKQAYPGAYWKTRLMALTVQFVQKDNASAIARKLDSLEVNYRNRIQQSDLHQALVRGLRGKVEIMTANPERGITRLRPTRDRYSSDQNPSWVSKAVRADHYFYQALAYRSMSKYDSALQSIAKGQRLISQQFSEGHPINARLGHLEAGILRSQSAPVKANKQINQSLAILKKHKLIGSPLGILLYREKGNLFSSTLQPKRATPYLKKSISLGERIYSGTSGVLVYPYMALGRAYKRQRQYEDALKQYQQALALARQIPKSDFRNRRLLNTYSELGDLHKKMGQYQASAKYLEQAFDIGQKVYPGSHEKLAMVRISLMTTNMKQGQFSAARKHFRDALSIYQQRLPEDHPKLGAKGYLRGAQLARLTGAFDTAMQYTKRAYQTFSKGHNCNKTICSPALSEITDPLNAFKTSIIQSQLLWDQYQRTTDQAILKRALAIHQSADSLAEQLQQKFYIGHDNASLALQAQQLYPFATGVCYHLAQDKEAPKPSAYYSEKAFYFSEKNKTLQLLGGLNKVQQHQARSLPDSLAANFRHLTDTIDRLRSKQKEQPESSPAYREALVNLKTRKEEFLEKLKQDHPDFYAISFHDQIVSLEQLQASLEQQDKALVTYSYHDSLLIGIGITSEQVTIKRLETPLNLADKVRRYRHQLANKQRYDQQLSYTLYQQLFKPFEGLGGASEIIIVPDGPISHLAFGTLARNPKPSQNPNYLVKYYAFTYSPSVSLWIQERDKPRSQLSSASTSQYFTGFAPSFKEEPAAVEPELVAGNRPRKTLEAIPGAQQEVSFCSDMFDGTIRVGDQATESAFKGKASQSKILHLATHGIVSDQSPAYNKLLFRKEAQSAEDGNLYTHELYNLDMHADLVVLSACNTGYGPIKQGQGHMSLARGFKLAGCQNILMTLWPIKDQVSTELVKDFYQNLADGQSREKALQQAKLTYLASHDRTNSNPHFWGSFVLMGSSEPIQSISAAGSNNGLYLWLIGSGVLLLILSGLGYISYYRWLT